MGSLIDLLQSGQLPMGAPDLQDPVEQLKALLAERRAVSGSSGDMPGAEGASVAPMSFGRLSPVQAPAPAVAEPSPVSVPARAPASNPVPESNFLDQVGAFVGGLSGEGGIHSLMANRKGQETENLTVKTLLDRNIASSPEEARAIARNPAALQAALVQAFSPKGFQLKNDEVRFVPGATPNSPAIEVARGESKSTVLPAGAKLIQGGRSVAENAPKPPPGYQWKDQSDPTQGTVPIEGGPADEKFRAAQRTDKTALDASIANLSQAQAEAKALLAHRGLGSNFGLMGTLPNVPGQEGAGAYTLLNQFKAKAGFQALQAMRDASKTGGALGNVSNQEGQRLENSVVALGNSQSVDDAKANLEQYIKDVEGAKTRAIAAYRRAYGESETRMAPQGRRGAQPDPLGLR